MNNCAITYSNIVLIKFENRNQYHLPTKKKVQKARDISTTLSYIMVSETEIVLNYAGLALLLKILDINKFQ